MEKAGAAAVGGELRARWWACERQGRDPEHKVYPYLLRGVAITRPGQVYSTDITYIRVGRGFAYLSAVIDWYSRKVLAWQPSNTMDTAFCMQVLNQSMEEARAGLGAYFRFYNTERPHQALDYQTPAQVHAATSQLLKAA